MNSGTKKDNNINSLHNHAEAVQGNTHDAIRNTQYGNRAKLLIVDDDRAVLGQLEEALRADYELLLASDKEEALRLARVHKPELVALDVKLNGDALGGKDGIEILEEIKSRDFFSKVIVITEDATKESALEAISKGAFDYYLKPIDVEEFKVILRRVLYIQNLERQNKELSDELHNKFKFYDLVGNSPEMDEVFRLIRDVAPTDATVLVTGESGTGKELVAKAIHYLSPRKERPFIVINCGAIPENLLESELFGHEKGSFTDAHAKKTGKLEIADKGTVFLDEIGEMSLNLQVKILRFLQERVIERVGSNITIGLDVRVIAATNSDLSRKIAEGSFRDDLFYRLSVVNIQLPPLKERGDDILTLACYFLDKYKNDVAHKDIKGFTKEAKDAVKTYSWPGNIREMENRIKRAVILARNSFISPVELGFSRGDDSDKDLDRNTEKLSLKEARRNLETELVKKALQETRGNMSLAAKMLGISRPSLYDLLRKHEISV